MGYDAHIARGLDAAWQRAERQRVDLAALRHVVLSDQHKGNRDGADDFQPCERAYNAALGYYLAAGYTLLVLGDVEELWECRARDVVRAYGYTLELEAAYHRAGRYVRFFGNHDDYWSSPRAVRRDLGAFFPGLEVLEALRLEVRGAAAGGAAAEVLLLHGHQGSTVSDRLRFLSRPIVRYGWRPIQRLTRIPVTTPARSFALRNRHDRAMHVWAERRGGVVLVAGHTHRPVFLPEPEAPKRARELHELIRAGAAPEAIAEKRAEVEWLRTVEGVAVGEGPPCYFNTGCCSFSDGDVTGIELADGEIRLVRWPDDRGEPRRKVLRTARLGSVLAACVRGS